MELLPFIFSLSFTYPFIFIIDPHACKTHVDIGWFCLGLWDRTSPLSVYVIEEVTPHSSSKNPNLSSASTIQGCFSQQGHWSLHVANPKEMNEILLDLSLVFDIFPCLKTFCCLGESFCLCKYRNLTVLFWWGGGFPLILLYCMKGMKYECFPSLPGGRWKSRLPCSPWKGKPYLHLLWFWV